MDKKIFLIIVFLFLLVGLSRPTLALKLIDISISPINPTIKENGCEQSYDTYCRIIKPKDYYVPKVGQEISFYIHAKNVLGGSYRTKLYSFNYQECEPELFCGDGICNNNETCETCPEDCGEYEEPEPEEPHNEENHHHSGGGGGMDICGDGICEIWEQEYCIKDCQQNISIEKKEIWFIPFEKNKQEIINLNSDIISYQEHNLMPVKTNKIMSFIESGKLIMVLTIGLFIILIGLVVVGWKK